MLVDALQTSSADSYVNVIKFHHRNMVKFGAGVVFERPSAGSASQKALICVWIILGSAPTAAGRYLLPSTGVRCRVVLPNLSFIPGNCGSL